MISVHLLHGTDLQRGDPALIEHWQQTRQGTIWIDIEGESRQSEIQWLTRLGAHRLAILDAQRPRHPPKVEHFDDNSFVLYRAIQDISEDLVLDIQSLSFFVSDNCLISVHQKPLACIDALRNSEQLADIMRCPAELMCSILKISASSYTDDIVAIEEALTDLEEQMAEAGDDALLNQVTFYRTRLRKLKRFFAYHEKVFAELLKEPELLPAQSEAIYHSIQDVYDKFERLLSLTSMYYDLCGDLSDAYLSLASHRLNRTMQVLTVITAIFIPLSFLAGLYGMNFIHMPELQWRYGYFAVLGLMGLIAIALLALFRYKKWL